MILLHSIDNQIANLNTQCIIDIIIFLLEDLVLKKFYLFGFFDHFLILGNNTAVQLKGNHRLHDYINANEIKVKQTKIFEKNIHRIS
jgi:hypothetical protein